MNLLRCLCLLLPLTYLHAAEVAEDFAYFVPIQMEQGSGLARITLPTSVYEGAVVPTLADVRVFDGKGRSAPYAREPRREEKLQGQAIGLRFFPVYSNGPVSMQGASLSVTTRGNDISVQVKSGAAAGVSSKRILRGYLLDLKSLQFPLSSLEFDWETGTQNSILAVTVEGSDDLDHWSTVVGNGTLARMQANGQTLLRNAVEFAFTKPKYMRIAFSDAAEVPTIKSIHARQGSTTVQASRSWKEISGKASGNGEFEFDLGGEFPLDRLQLSVPGNNIVLPVEVLSKKRDTDPWTTVARHTFYRIQQGTLFIENPDFVVFTSRHRYWKVRAAQPDALSEPLILRAGWMPESLVFVAQGEAPFRLVYGNSLARDVALPIESVVPAYGTDRASRVVVATAGDQQVLAGPSAKAPRTNYKTVALWAALVVGVVLLGWMAWSLTRQMRAPIKGTSRAEY